jgi:hypothetical protein
MFVNEMKRFLQKMSLAARSSRQWGSTDVEDEQNSEDVRLGVFVFRKDETRVTDNVMNALKPSLATRGNKRR